MPRPPEQLPWQRAHQMRWRRPCPLPLTQTALRLLRHIGLGSAQASPPTGTFQIHLPPASLQAGSDAPVLPAAPASENLSHLNVVYDLSLYSDTLVHFMFPFKVPMDEQRVGSECLKARSKPRVVRGRQKQVDIIIASGLGIKAGASCSSKDSRCVQLAHDHCVQA